MSILATKNFDLSRMYGASAPAAPCGMLYFSRRSQVSSPDESVADRIRIWYSPATNFASILTPRSRLLGDPPSSAADSISITGAGAGIGGIGGAHGSCSQ